MKVECADHDDKKEYRFVQDKGVVINAASTGPNSFACDVMPAHFGLERFKDRVKDDVVVQGGEANCGVLTENCTMEMNPNTHREDG